MTEKRYFDDPMTTEFTAEIVGTRRNARGFGVILPFTFFYPTGGGQSNDTGTIGSARVVDVFADGDEIVHLLNKEIEVGSHPAKIDWDRRFANMQHHSGQHIFSAVFWHELGLETLSSHISGTAPSTIDFNVNALSAKKIALVEEKANQLVFENRAMKAYFVENKDGIPFRRPPKVDGAIRVIEIDGYDYSACGGTHCPQTGMVGLVKIVKIERINQKTRIHFVAGWQALGYLQQVQFAAQETAALLAVGVEGMSEAVAHLQSQLKESQSELKSLQQMALKIEAEKMAQFSESVEDKWLVTAIFENRDPGELRSLAMKLRAYPGTVAILASFDGAKLSLVVACAEDTGLSASDLLKKHLAPFNGRGGGDKSVAQGGGAADEDSMENLFSQTKSYLAE